MKMMIALIALAMAGCETIQHPTLLYGNSSYGRVALTTPYPSLPDTPTYDHQRHNEMARTFERMQVEISRYKASIKSNMDRVQKETEEWVRREDKEELQTQKQIWKQDRHELEARIEILQGVAQSLTAERDAALKQVATLEQVARQRPAATTIPAHLTGEARLNWLHEHPEVSRAIDREMQAELPDLIIEQTGDSTFEIYGTK